MKIPAFQLQRHVPLPRHRNEDSLPQADGVLKNKFIFSDAFLKYVACTTGIALFAHLAVFDYLLKNLFHCHQVILLMFLE